MSPSGRNATISNMSSRGWQVAYQFALIALVTLAPLTISLGLSPLPNPVIQPEFYTVVAGIIPVLYLALAIEFSGMFRLSRAEQQEQRARFHTSPSGRQGVLLEILGRAGSAVALALLAVEGEVAALIAVARGEGSIELLTIIVVSSISLFVILIVAYVHSVID